MTRLASEAPLYRALRSAISKGLTPLLCFDLIPQIPQPVNPTLLLLLLQFPAVRYKQILEINFIRIKDIIVRVTVHKYPFCQTVCKAHSMAHFVNGYICPLTTGKRT